MAHGPGGHVTALVAVIENRNPSVNVTVGNAAVTVASGDVTPTRTDPWVVSSTGAAITATASPSVTFSGYTPLENDVIAFFFSSTSAVAVVANASLPAGWVNPLGDGVEVNADTCGMGCLYHLVTAAEQTAVTLTYTATSAITSTTGYTQAVAVRNVAPADVVDGSGTTFDSANTVTPHVLASITGSGVLLDGSLVVSSVTKDATGDYGASAPAGWTRLRNDNTNQGRWIGYRDTHTVVNTNVNATNITPSAGDEYASITLAFTRLVSGTNVTIPAAATVSVAANNSSAAVAPTTGNAAVTVTANSVTISRLVDVGVAAVTATANNSAAAVAPTTGNAAVTATANNSGSAVAPTIGAAAVTVTGNNVTVSAGADVNVTVGSAAVSVTGNNPLHSIAVGLNDIEGVATVAVDWFFEPVTPSISVAHAVGSAVVAATGNNSSSAVAHAVGNAAVTATANNATVSTTSNVNVTVGSAAVTVTANNSSSAVAHNVVTAAVRVVAANANSKWPTSVSANGRYILDQDGNPWMMHGEAAWNLMVALSIQDAIVYLDDRAARGVNLVIASFMEHYYGSDNFYGDVPFTGTAYQSGLTEAYWLNVDAIVDHAAARGITIMAFPAYLGFSGTEEGWDTEIAAASNANMDTLGTTLGNRYGAKANLIWTMGADQNPDATLLDRLDHLATSIAATSDNHLITGHTVRNHDAAEYWTSYSWLGLNSIYIADPNTVSISATGYNRATVRPTFLIEGKYQNAVGITLAQIRREQWQCILVGGIGGHIVGNESVWQLGLDAGDWQAHLGDLSITHSHQIKVLVDTVTSYVWKSLAPDLTDTFLTSGESSGTTQAAASFSTHLGLVYVATTGSITVDLTELSGAATVLTRWFDPTAGTFTAVGTFATSAPQTITHPGANAAGDNDWVLTVVDATVNVTVGSAAVSVTGNNATVSTASNVNVNVGSAAVSVTANNSSSAVAGGVGFAAVTATANNVTANPAPSLGSAAVTATANNASHQIASTIGSAPVTVTGNDSGSTVAHAVGTSVVTVTGNNATVSTSAQTNVSVGVATVAVAANDSGSSAAHAVGVAAVTVTANQVTAAPAITVGSAGVTATANQAHANIAATVFVAAVVLVVANNLQPDNGEGVATLVGLIRASRPDIHRVSRPHSHRAQRPEV